MGRLICDWIILLVEGLVLWEVRYSLWIGWMDGRVRRCRIFYEMRNRQSSEEVFGGFYD